MQKFRDLTKKWQAESKPRLTQRLFEIRLPIEDAASLEALHELYPNASREEMITDLLAVALDEVEAALPYVEGNRVMSVDEWGNPVYEDVGPSPAFRKLRKKHLEALKARAGQ